MYMATIPKLKRDEDDDDDGLPNVYEGKKPDGEVTFEDLYNIM